MAISWIMYYMTDCYMDIKPDFEKSVINFKWQEYCHCPPGSTKITVKWQGQLEISVQITQKCSNIITCQLSLFSAM